MPQLGKLSELRLLAAIVILMTFAGAGFAQSPFGPPPVEGGLAPPAASAPAYPTREVYPPRQTPPPGNPISPESNSSVVSPYSDPSLVGSRYAPQSASPPSEPEATTQYRPAPVTPSRPIDYPVAQQPGGQVLAEANINEQCKVYARVGGQVILGCEFLARVDGIMEANKDRIPPQNWETQRLVLIKEVLEQMVENKLVVADARRKIPQEAMPNVEKQVNAQFDTSQIPKMMADAKVESKAELEVQLRKAGSSLADQRRIFLERAIGAQWVRQSIDADREVTHAEMWSYYQEHREEYRQEARAKWQELHVSFASVPSREAAFQKIAQMGNDFVERKIPFEVIAKTNSNGLTAKEGGINNWTTKGSLKSEKLDAALFQLPLNRMSTIIEDTDGFYIIRVVEREPEQYTPFREAQVEIADKIKADDRQQQIEQYYATLRKEVPVWTIFDDPQIAAQLPPTRR